MALAQPAWAQGITDVITSTGDFAPNGNGRLSTFVTIPVLNNAGQVAFAASLTGTSGGAADDRGVFRGAGGPLTQIAREFVSIGSRTILDQPPVLLNDAGQVAFASQLLSGTVGDTPRNAIERGDGTTLVTMARQGDSVPGGNGAFNTFTLPLSALNSNGSVAFYANLTGTSGGIFDDSGIWRSTGSVMTQIAREGGAAGGGTIFAMRTPEINTLGQVAFAAQLDHPTVPGAQGIFRGSGSALTQIVLSGQPAPDGNGVFNIINDPALNASGQAAFEASLALTRGGTGDNHGIFRGAGSAITQIARKGQPAPDGLGTFSDLSGPIINTSGQVAFTARLEGRDVFNPINDEAIFRGSGGALTQIVREDQPFEDGKFTGPIHHLAFNDLGQVAFFASIHDSGGVNEGLFLGNGIDIIRVAGIGQSLAGGVISDLNPTAVPQGGLNNAGQVAYWVEFADGREAIARYTIPEIHWTAQGSGAWTTGANWTQGIEPNSFHDTFIDPDRTLTVTAPSTNKTVKSLTLGSSPGATTNEIATLVLAGASAGDFTSLEDATIARFGELVLQDGRTFSAPRLLNSGVIRGTGSVSADVSNRDQGLIRAGPGERLTLNGETHSNSGLIEVIGTEVERAEMQFLGVLTNVPQVQIVARNALLRFNQHYASTGLINRGFLDISSGRTDIFGNITNDRPFGQIIVSGNSTATFYDSVFNDGRFNVSTGSTAVIFGTLSRNGIVGGGTAFLEGNVTPGASPGTMSFGGDVHFGPLASLDIELGGTIPGSQYDQINVAGAVTFGGTLAIDLIDGFTPANGDDFTLATYAGHVGIFDVVDYPPLPAGLTWSLDYGATQLILSTTRSLLPGDIDLDGDVDRTDAALFTPHLGTATASEWTTGDFDGDAATTLIDLTLLQANLGRMAAPSAAAAVPEPGTLTLLLISGLVSIGFARRLAPANAVGRKKLVDGRGHNRARLAWD